MQCHVVADVGVWSTHIPTVRLSVGARYKRVFVTAAASMHVYPRAFESEIDRPLVFAVVPFEQFLFWSAGLGAGLTF